MNSRKQKKVRNEHVASLSSYTKMYSAHPVDPETIIIDFSNAVASVAKIDRVHDDSLVTTDGKSWSLEFTVPSIYFRQQPQTQAQCGEILGVYVSPLDVETAATSWFPSPFDSYLIYGPVALVLFSGSVVKSLSVFDCVSMMSTWFSNPHRPIVSESAVFCGDFELEACNVSEMAEAAYYFSLAQFIAKQSASRSSKVSKQSGPQMMMSILEITKAALSQIVVSVTSAICVPRAPRAAVSVVYMDTSVASDAMSSETESPCAKQPRMVAPTISDDEDDDSNNEDDVEDCVMHMDTDEDEIAAAAAILDADSDADEF